MPGDPKECRQRAARCLEFAAEAANEGVKKMFLGLARHWEMLAEELERTKKLLEDEDGALLVTYGAKKRRRRKPLAAGPKRKKSNRNKKKRSGSRRTDTETIWSL